MAKLTKTERAKISRRTWRERRKTVTKICSFCYKPIFAGGIKRGGLWYHKTHYAEKKMGFTPKQMLNPWKGRQRSNPRPPADWFAKMYAKTKAEYPGRSARDLNAITAGIWWNYPEDTRARLIKEYD